MVACYGLGTARLDQIRAHRLLQRRRRLRVRPDTARAAAGRPPHKGPPILLEQPICLLLRQGSTAGCNGGFADRSPGLDQQRAGRSLLARRGSRTGPLPAASGRQTAPFSAAAGARTCGLTDERADEFDVLIPPEQWRSPARQDEPPPLIETFSHKLMCHGDHARLRGPSPDRCCLGDDGGLVLAGANVRRHRRPATPDMRGHRPRHLVLDPALPVRRPVYRTKKQFRS